jgi:glycosyltransferase involved in cell wall biosynthesis
MASALPVIVSEQVGCASTLVIEGFNGFTFSPNDSVQLTEKMKYIASLTEEELLNMGKNSKNIISKWGIDKFCLGINEAINYVIDDFYKESSLISSIIIRLWNGRYNPV